MSRVGRSSDPTSEVIEITTIWTDDTRKVTPKRNPQRPSSTQLNEKNGFSITKAEGFKTSAEKKLDTLNNEKSYLNGISNTSCIRW